jgi:hypothetical protein
MAFDRNSDEAIEFAHDLAHPNMSAAAGYFDESIGESLD